MKRIVPLSLILLPMLGASVVQARDSHVKSSRRMGAYIGAAAARRSATRSVPGHVLSTKLENEDGKMQYAVMIKGRKAMHEVMVDAHTGRVASQEKVTAGEEAREAAEEAHGSHSGRSAHKH